MTRVTIVRLRELADIASDQTGETVQIYAAYGAYGVHQIVNESGGARELLGLGTAREAAAFLSGMIAAARMIGGGR